MLALSYSFENEVLLSYSKLICLEYRHISSYNYNVYVRFATRNCTEKTSFQYDIKNVNELIKAVINSVAKEVVEEFETNPNRDFNLQGKRAIY